MGSPVLSSVGTLLRLQIIPSYHFNTLNTITAGQHSSLVDTAHDVTPNQVFVYDSDAVANPLDDDDLLGHATLNVVTIRYAGCVRHR